MDFGSLRQSGLRCYSPKSVQMCGQLDRSNAPLDQELNEDLGSSGQVRFPKKVPGDVPTLETASLFVLVRRFSLLLCFIFLGVSRRFLSVYFYSLQTASSDLVTDFISASYNLFIAGFNGQIESHHLLLVWWFQNVA